MRYAFVFFVAGVISLFISGFYERYFFSVNEIKVVHGTLNGYYQEQVRRRLAGNSHRFYYWISLNEVHAPFKLRSELVPQFKRSDFEIFVKQGDSLSLSYLSLPGLFGSDENVLLSIDAGKFTFLHGESSIEQLAETNDVGLVGSIISIIVGIVLFKFAAKTAANTQNNAAQVTSHER